MKNVLELIVYSIRKYQKINNFHKSVKKIDIEKVIEYLRAFYKYYRLCNLKKWRLGQTNDGLVNIRNIPTEMGKYAVNG